MSLKEKKASELKKQIAKALLLKERNKIADETFKSDLKDAVDSITYLMDEFEINEYEFVEDGAYSSVFRSNPRVISCKRVRPQSVVYDAKAVYGRLGKEVGGRVVSKEYVVKDMSGLIELLKWCGVKPEQFKRFIDVRYSLDVKALDNIYQTGVIRLQDLKGCYTVKSGKEYLKISSKNVSRSDKD